MVFTGRPCCTFVFTSRPSSHIYEIHNLCFTSSLCDCQYLHANTLSISAVNSTGGPCRQTEMIFPCVQSISATWIRSNKLKQKERTWNVRASTNLSMAFIQRTSHTGYAFTCMRIRQVTTIYPAWKYEAIRKGHNWFRRFLLPGGNHTHVKQSWIPIPCGVLGYADGVQGCHIIGGIPLWRGCLECNMHVWRKD